MIPADEARFIALWSQGASYRALAQALGCALGTVATRAKRLAAQGKIQARPRGGAYPRQHAQGRANTEGGHPPVQRPVQNIDTGAVHSADTGAVQALSVEVEQLKTDVTGLHRLVQSLIERLDHPPVQTPVQITALPPYPQGKAVRWNLWILDAIRDELAALAAERGVSPSQLVQEILWNALSDRHASPR
jgi:hypothetical protein